MNPKPKTAYLVTGFPGFIGKRLVAHLAERRPEAALHLLVEPRFAADARRHARALPHPARIRVLEGDVAHMHLGLSGEEYGSLCDGLTDLFHLAALHPVGAAREQAERVNVEGTRNVLELAGDCRHLRRLSHFSTAFVAGDRVGVVAEDELDVGQAFRTPYEETKFLGEKLIARAARRLPITVLRPAIVVGDSGTGEIDHFHGPYYLALRLLARPWGRAPNLPFGGAAPLHVVPVDFVVAAALALSENPAAAGRTFHLVDPNPMSARRAYETIAALVGADAAKPGLRARARTRLLGLPLPSHLERRERETLAFASTLVFFNSANTVELLEGTGVRCPPLAAYLPTLVDFVRRYYRQQDHQSAQIDDPLDQPSSTAPRAP